jgi:hypothetical protein
MELPPLSTDTTPIRLVSLSGVTLDIPANMWAMVRWAASILGGWRPAGTKPPAGWAGDHPWAGEYEPKVGQIVEAEDAAALAAALDRATTAMASLALMPAAVKEATLREALTPGTADKVMPAVQKYGPGQNPGRDFRTHVALEEYAAFFREGAFRVGEPEPSIRVGAADRPRE